MQAGRTSTLAAAKVAAITIIITSALAIAPAHADLKRMDGSGIAAAMEGKTISGKRDGKAFVQTFDAGGITVRKVAEEAALEGSWQVREDRFCLQWPAAAWTCYDIFGDGDVVVFVGEDGEQWPARIAGGN